MPKSLSQQIDDLGYEIAGDIDHGECFYEEDMLNDFIENLDKMKKLAKKFYQQNKAETEEN